MSIDDDFFDIEDILDNIPKSLGAKESFSRIEKYVAYIEIENERLIKENKAMRAVIKIVKGD